MGFLLKSKEEDKHWLYITHCTVHVWLRLILWNPVNRSPLASSVRAILQARTVEWIALPSSRRSSWPRDWTLISYVSYIGRRVLYHWCHLRSPHCTEDDLTLLHPTLPILPKTFLLMLSREFSAGQFPLPTFFSLPTWIWSKLISLPVSLPKPLLQSQSNQVCC